MALRDLSPPREVQPIVLGIFGTRTRSALSEKKMVEHILTPILQELGRVPDKVLVPSEGDSSAIIEMWAESLRIPCHIITAEWGRLGKAAVHMRDARIQAEATHALVFLSNRSARYEKLAEQMATNKRNPKTVFTSSYQDSCLEQLVPSEPQQPVRQAAPAGKRGSGRGRQSQQGQTQLSFGSQTPS
jgi:hypothetical protein